MHTITFYSYKGGVGRSLALANIAKRLSEFDRKVCMMDFDLEAPGLPYKFINPVTNKIQKGIVDYIYDFTNKGKLPDSILDYTIKFRLNPNKNFVHLIPAGNVEASDYWKKLSSINWYELLYDNNGLSFFLDLKEKIKREINPDFLLIDSRTGISEMAGITISLMANEVVVIAANNRENLSGARKIIQSLSRPDNSILGDIPKITFVLSRIPFTNTPEDRLKEQALISKVKKDFASIYKDDLVVIHSDRELEENEKLKISSEFEDGFSEISKDYLKLFEKLTKDDLSDEEVKKFNQIKESERLFRLATNSKNQIEKIELITKAIELNNIPEYYVFRGILNYTNKNYDLAIADYSNAVEIDKNNFDANLGIAEIYYKEKKINEAIDVLNNLTLAYPNASIIYFKKALAYDKIGDKEKELENYYKALEIDADDPSIYNNLANHFRLEKDYNKALELIYKSLELNPKQSIAFATLAEINAELGNINEFYLNFELALVNGTQNLIESISEENVYKKFISENRFIQLLERYSISLSDLKFATF